MVKYVLYDENGNVVDESDKAFESEGTVSLDKQEVPLQEQPTQERQAPKYKGPSEGATGFTDLYTASIIDAMPFGIGHRLMGAAKAATSDVPYKQAVKEAKDYTKSVKDYYGYDHLGIEGFTKATSEGALTLGALQALPVVGPAVSKGVNSTSLRYLAPSLGGLEATRKTAEVLSDVLPSQGRGITGSDVVSAVGQGLTSGGTEAALLGLGGTLGPKKALPLALGIGAVGAPIMASLQGREATVSDYLGGMLSAAAQSTFGGLSKAKAGTGVKGTPEVKLTDKYKKLGNRGDVLPTLEFTEKAVPDDVKLLFANTDTNKGVLNAMRRVDAKEVQKLAVPFSKGIKELEKNLDYKVLSSMGRVTKEEVRRNIDRASEELAIVKDAILNEKPAVTDKEIRAGVNAAAARYGWTKDKADGVYASIIGAYNRASKESLKLKPAVGRVDTGKMTTKVVNGVKTQVPVYAAGRRTDVLMDSKKMLSELSNEKQITDTIEAYKAIRELFGDLGSVWAKADNLYHYWKSMDDASGVAAKEAADLVDIDEILKVYSKPGAMITPASKVRWALKKSDPVDIEKLLGKEAVLLPKDVLDEIDRLNYMKTANKLVRAEEGVNFDDFMVGEKTQRLVASPSLGQNFAKYMGLATATATGKRHFDKKAVKDVIDFISKKTVGEAKPLFKAGHGNIWTDSAWGDIVESILNKLPKKGGK